MWEYFGLKEKKETRRWVLKAPLHTWVVGSLLEGIPDVDIIWTHRSLDDNILSMSNLKSAIQVR